MSQFIFLLLGYGTKVGLVPLHAWLPDATRKGRPRSRPVLSGLLLNVALYAVLRFQVLLAANPHTFAPGPLMITTGLVFADLRRVMLYRRRDIKRLFATRRSSTWASSRLRLHGRTASRISPAFCT